MCVLANSYINEDRRLYCLRDELGSTEETKSTLPDPLPKASGKYKIE